MMLQQNPGFKDVILWSKTQFPAPLMQTVRMIFYRFLRTVQLILVLLMMIP